MVIFESRLSVLVRKVLLPRGIGAVTGLLFVYLWLTIQVGTSSSFALTISIIVTLLLYIGATYDPLTFKKRLSWTRGIVACVFGFGVSALAMNISIGEWTYLVAVYINSSYVFAKIACANLGCCGINSINDKQFYNWPFRPRLQSFEVVVSFTLLFLGALLAFFSLSLAATLIIACHALLRVFSARFRFPYRQRFSFVFELGTGGLSFLFIALMVLDMVA